MENNGNNRTVWLIQHPHYKSNSVDHDSVKSFYCKILTKSCKPIRSNSVGSQHFKIQYNDKSNFGNKSQSDEHINYIAEEKPILGKEVNKINSICNEDGKSCSTALNKETNKTKNDFENMPTFDGREYNDNSKDYNSIKVDNEMKNSEKSTCKHSTGSIICIPSIVLLENKGQGFGGNINGIDDTLLQVNVKNHCYSCSCDKRMQINVNPHPVHIQFNNDTISILCPTPIIIPIEKGLICRKSYRSGQTSNKTAQNTHFKYTQGNNLEWGIHKTNREFTIQTSPKSHESIRKCLERKRRDHKGEIIKGEDTHCKFTSNKRIRNYISIPVEDDESKNYAGLDKQAYKNVNK